MRVYTTIIAASLLIGACASPEYRPSFRIQEDNTVDINSIEQLQSYFTCHPERDIIISSSHRGGMMDGYPANFIGLPLSRKELRELAN